jgi:thioredoxin reductase (NADPH)
MLLAKATHVAYERKPYVVELQDGSRIPARAIVIATGAKYSKLALDNLAPFEGAGVYYGATFIEAQLCKGEDVIVVGGGNSAGQAAVFLAETHESRLCTCAIRRFGRYHVAIPDSPH